MNLTKQELFEVIDIYRRINKKKYNSSVDVSAQRVLEGVKLLMEGEEFELRRADDVGS